MTEFEWDMGEEDEIKMIDKILASIAQSKIPTFGEQKAIVKNTKLPKK